MSSRSRHLVTGIVALVIGSALIACTRHPAAVQANANPDPRFAGLGTPDHRIIVRLVSRNQVLTVSSGGSTGPVYSVADKEGRVMLTHATLDDLRVRHPDLYRQIETTVAADVSPAVDASAKEEPLGIATIAPQPIPFAGRYAGE
jgi:hypothetical protein